MRRSTLLALLALALLALLAAERSRASAREDDLDDEDGEDDDEEGGGLGLDGMLSEDELKPKTPDYNVWDAVREGTFATHNFYGGSGAAYTYENCAVYRCPGGARRAKNAAYRPPAEAKCSLYNNDYNVEWLRYAREFGLGGCCARHARCYGMCGTGRRLCDQRYGECLVRACRDQDLAYDRDECAKLGRILLTAAVQAGCDSYKESQADACVCADRDDL